MSLLPVEKEPQCILQSEETNVNIFTAVKAIAQLMETAKPVTEEADGIHFHPKTMIIGQYYPFKFKKKEYLLKKSSDNIIDIYEIKN